MCHKKDVNSEAAELGNDSDTDYSDSSGSDSITSDEQMSDGEDENRGDVSNHSDILAGTAEDEEEDELVKAIKREKEKVREHPADIQCEDFIVDISLHPHENVLAVGTVVGDIVLYKYSNESNELVQTCETHTKACRSLQISEDGTTIYSCSKDKSIVLTDASTGKMKKFYDNAHDDPLYSLLVIDENLFSSGDESGTVKVWDVRRKDPLFSLKEADDFISSMVTTEEKRYLVCSSGEGTVTALNLRTRKLHIQSEPYEEELNCMGLMRSDTKLVVGSSKGKLYLFNWGEFGFHSDEFPGPKQSINCLVPVSENIIIAAGEDGILRAVHLFPHRHLGIVGQHQSSIEAADISGDGDYLVSCSLDQTIKFWNIRYFEDVEVDERKKSKKKKEMNHNLPSSKHRNVSDFFAELA